MRSINSADRLLHPLDPSIAASNSNAVFKTEFNTLFASRSISFYTAIMSTQDNTSTLKSVMDTATGYVQSGIAAVTGSAGDQVSGPLN